jgi:hypothetical protein
MGAPKEAVVVMDGRAGSPGDVPALVRSFQQEGGRSPRRTGATLGKPSLQGLHHAYRRAQGPDRPASGREASCHSGRWAAGRSFQLWNHYSAAVFKAKLPFTTI